MKRICLTGLGLLLFASCGLVKKKTTYAERPTVSVAATEASRGTLPEDPDSFAEAATTGSPAAVPASTADAVVSTALTFAGVDYKYGGTTRRGMDCSGLLYVAFTENDFPFPRVSHEMAEEGRKVKVQQVQKGDLLFFRTTRRGGKINHVGLVVAVEGDDVRFIHSTTSRGVIVSSLREGFWNYAFVKATRVF